MKFFAVLLALAFPPAIYFETLGAKRDQQLQSAGVQLRDLDIHIEQARSARRKLSQFHQEQRRLGEELQKLRVILPPAMAIDQVRAMSDAIAAVNGVHVTKFEPRPPASGEFQQQSVVAELIGSAERTSAFMREIQNAARIIDVSSVTLQNDPAGWRTDFVMTCYALPDAR
ncbi:MAG: hypothetical protein DMF58_09875 [Acidobacteria bacterium]|nr:MAG: hypothetical protein DMF58_09875 [Acidobacteriota bacterium]